jgi:hypothetical protein
LKRLVSLRVQGANAVDRDEIVARTEDHVRSLLAGEGTGHDWWHTDRVRRLALRIAADEGAGGNPFVVELAALLHDIADWKFHDGDAEVGPRRAAAWLDGLGVEPAVVAHVAEIVGDLSFKGAGVPRPMRTLEGRVVQDADRLDAIGAIGVAEPSPTAVGAGGRSTSRGSRPFVTTRRKPTGRPPVRRSTISTRSCCSSRS